MRNPVVVLLVVLLVLALVGGFQPSVTQNYGYWPGGSAGTILVVLLVLLLLGVV